MESDFNWGPTVAHELLRELSLWPLHKHNGNKESTALVELKFSLLLLALLISREAIVFFSHALTWKETKGQRP